MRTGDPYEGPLPFGEGLPELPIPRPGETVEPTSSTPVPIAPPSLGGGASFTVAGGNDRRTADRRSSEAATGPQLDPGEDADAAADRFTWELAAQLTAGMLGNPARNQASVKDAMALFDQFLHEMQAYSRIVPRLERDGDRHRREHGEYFRSMAAERAPETEATQSATPAPKPAAPAQPAARAEPSQPRPLPGYTPLPPGARTRYVPGSMSTTGTSSDEDVAAA